MLPVASAGKPAAAATLVNIPRLITAYYSDRPNPSVASLHLFQNRQKWPTNAATGKTGVSTQMIDRVAAKLARRLYEVPVGFKWFVEGLLDASLAFGGEESAGASFVRQDGTAWTTDKDGIVPALLAAEITARNGRDPGEIYGDLTREFGEPLYERVESPATPDQKALLAKLSPQQMKLTDLAGEPIQAVITRAPGNGAGSEAEALYELLDGQVIPEFYARDANGISAAWVKRMRASMAQLTPRFSADRTVRKYTEQHYLPAAASYRDRLANTVALGRQIVDWRHHLASHSDSLTFGEVKVETTGDQHLFAIQVQLGAVDPKAVQVELYAEAIGDGASSLQAMRRARQLPDAASSYVYSAAAPASRTAADYTTRVIPHCNGVAIPLEDSRIRRQR